MRDAAVAEEFGLLTLSRQDKTVERAGITEATGRKHDNTITRGIMNLSLAT